MNNLQQERDTILQFFTQLLQNSIDFSSLDTSEIAALNEIRDSFLSMSDEEQLEIRSDSSNHLRDEQEKAIEEETAAKERSMRVNSEQTPSALAAASAANEAKEKIKSDVAAAEAEAAAKRAARTSDAEKKALVKLNERRSARADENRRRGKDFTSVGPRSGGRRKSRKSTFRRHRKH